MNRKLLTRMSILGGALLLFAAPLMAQEVLTLNFDTVPAGVACGEVWVEEGQDLQFTDTIATDCDGGGNCFFDDGTGGGSLWLFPGRLAVDFGADFLLYTIEIDVADYCGIGCTRAFAYLDGVQVGFDDNDTRGAPETLVIDLGAEGAMVDAIAVSSCEGEVTKSSIRIFSQTVGDGDVSWGGVKTLFR